MSAVILYHTGKASYKQTEKRYYDPWSSHIWLCLEQIRKWNPSLPIYMIVDDVNSVPNKEKFDALKIVVEPIDQLTPRYDVLSLDYLIDDPNPTPRACAFRYFYIEAVIKKHGLKNVFTFDNDVLVFCDLDSVGKKLSALYRNGITSESMAAFILGMMFIRDYESFSFINDKFWEALNGKGKLLTDMFIWKMIADELGTEHISKLPSWIAGGHGYSELHKVIGGIFDPSSIGQHLLGCDNGNRLGCLFPHHVIHQLLANNPRRWQFVTNTDEYGRKQYFVKDNSSGNLTKILSIHVHCKKLSELM